MKTEKYGTLNPDFPFPIYKTPFFYGWVILIFGSISFLFSIPGQTIGVSPYTDYLIQALGLSRTDLSLAYFIGTMCSALLLTSAGKFYDRFGDRIIGSVVCLLFGLVLIILSYVDKIFQSLSFFHKILTSSLTAIIIMSFSFFIIRLLGQGLITMVSRNMIMKWFDARRGLANAILGTCITLGLSSSPGVLNQMIEMMTWQGSWRFLGFTIGIPGVLIFFLIARDSPQQCGLQPDGLLKEKKQANDKPKAVTRHYTLLEAQKTFAFWIFLLTNTMFGLIITASSFHIANLFEHAAMTRSQAFIIFFPAAVISVVLNFIASWASDFIKLKYILQVELMGLLLFLFSLLILKPGYPVILLIIGLGMVQGMFGVLSTVVWPKFYGIKYLGTITGFAMGFLVAGSAIGPYFFSLSQKILLSYHGAIGICLVICIILYILSFKADKEEEK
ncbi:MAG: MFS transporter [Spirochaetes bacterium]|nr:MFS transporter [Spirochaetota bacterium]